ncbi:MAG: hypothetical protein QM496_12695 [Verrucomicrobiota bacterium]
MSLVSNRTRLATLTKILVNDWQLTKEHWQDKQALQFEKQYIEGLLHQVSATTEIIDKLDKLITRVKKDCE